MARSAPKSTEVITINGCASCAARCPDNMGNANTAVCSRCGSTTKRLQRMSPTENTVFLVEPSPRA